VLLTVTHLVANQRQPTAPSPQTVRAIGAQPVPSSAQSQPTGPPQRNKFGQFLEKVETDPVVWITLIIAFFAGWQIRIYGQMRDHAKMTERAYIQPWCLHPGIQFKHFQSGNDVATLHMQIKNCGRTPARITTAVLSLSIRPTGAALPEHPEYPDPIPRQTIKMFLVTNADFFVGDALTLSANDMKALKESRTQTIVALGYVDYIDRFGDRHRAGVGMVYERVTEYVMERRTAGERAPGSNLIFITSPNNNYGLCLAGSPRYPSAYVARP